MVNEIKLISLSEARKTGNTWYFTGKPCCRGHIAKRATVNQTCVECVSEKAKKRRADNPEYIRSLERNRYNNNIDKKRESMRKSRLNNIDKRRKYDKLRYNDLERKKWQKQQAIMWAKNNKGKRNFFTAARRSWIKIATPKWLTKEMKLQIRYFYIKAKKIEGNYHVDHIHPLRSKNFCGLHVPWNLQILSALENIQKGNRYVADRELCSNLKEA